MTWHTELPTKPGYYALRLNRDWSIDMWREVPRGWFVIGARYNGWGWVEGDTPISQDYVIAWHELPAATSPAPAPASPEQDGKP